MGRMPLLGEAKGVRYNMAETTQYSFDLKEIATALIKHHGIREGKWVTQFEFNLGAGNIGLTPGEAKPSAFVQINKVLLARAVEGVSADLIVDASEVAKAEKGLKEKSRTLTKTKRGG